jgi:hypothetical protein
MKHISTLVCIAIASLDLTTGTSMAETYQLSGKAYTLNWPSGDWNGKHAFPGVYCIEFPAPKSARRLVHAMFNKGAIYLTSVDYPDGVTANIAVSSIPAGRTAEEEMARILANEKRTEQVSGQSSAIVEFQTAFGPTVGLTVKNVLGSAPEGPYPLIKPFFKPADRQIHSLGVHRLFVRGPDRFEVAVLQMLRPPATENTESEVTQRLTALADEVVKLLQTCTATFPPRVPK